MFRVLSRIVLIPTLSLVLLSGFAAGVAAQGVTTASIAGIVNDAQGQPMPGVTVVRAPRHRDHLFHAIVITHSTAS